MRVSLCLAVSLAACGGGVKDIKDPAPAAPEANCRIAAAHIADLVVSVQDPKPPDDAVNKLIDQTAQMCESSQWSAAAQACFSKVTSVEAADACTKELTPAQLETLGGGPKNAEPGSVPTEAPNGGAIGGAPEAPIPTTSPPPPPTRKAKGGGKTGDPCDGGE